MTGPTAKGPERSPHLPEQALRAEPMVWAWLVAIGADLLLNAGVFSGLFDQDREPGLLTDATLFARIPIAYLTVAIGVAATAWTLDRVDIRGARHGLAAGASIGLVFGATGVVWLWTAIEMTPAFVASAVVVQVAQMGSAGVVLGAVRSGLPRRQLRMRATGAALALAVTGIAIQNAIS